MKMGGELARSAGVFSAASFVPLTVARASQLSLLAACMGFLFASRAIYVLVSARWLNAGTEAGVVAGFVLEFALALAIALNAFGCRKSLSIRIFDSRPLQWVMLYLAFSGCSLLWSTAASVGTSALYWGELPCDVCIVVLLVRNCGAEFAAHSLMKGFISGTCILAAIAWIMPAAADLRLGDIDYFNTNQIGNLCALSLLMCNLLAKRGDGIWAGITWLLVTTLFRSLSKSTLIAFAACLVYGLIRDSGAKRATKWLLVGSGITLTLIFWGLLSAYYGAYTTTGNQAETLTGRTAIWAWALDASLARPWFGNGFDAMWKVAPPFGGDLFEARHAENELLQQFFSYGACGIVLLAGVYGSLYRRIRKIPQDPERVALTAFLVYVLVRGAAEAEPFDLLLPSWLIAALAFLLERDAQCAGSNDRLRHPQAECRQDKSF
ncbi:MAG TPA: O-antigen ligase family protein [Terracidiphilus sp.]|nr:O-antigen ligase family protein [Terracidiphilus sp.]